MSYDILPSTICILKNTFITTTISIWIVNPFAVAFYLYTKSTQTKWRFSLKTKTSGKFIAQPRKSHWNTIILRTNTTHECVWKISFLMANNFSATFDKTTKMGNKNIEVVRCFGKKKNSQKKTKVSTAIIFVLRPKYG